jgi:hypothetical protein
MPQEIKGPRAGTRWAFYKLPITYPIIPSLQTEVNGYLRELTSAYREAVASDNPRVMRLGLQVLWHGLRTFLPSEGV